MKSKVFRIEIWTDDTATACRAEITEEKYQACMPHYQPVAKIQAATPEQLAALLADKLVQAAQG